MIGVVAVIAVVLVLTLGGDTTETPSSPQPATSGSPVPAPLQDALDQLQESITP